MNLPSLTDTRNALFYFVSIAIAMFFFVMSIAYILLTISVNAGRISDLALIEAAIQTSAAQLAKNPAPEDVPFIRDALKDLNNQRTTQKKDIDYGQDRFHSMTFRACALAFNSNCFHRNSSAMNTIYLGIASGILGACLFFFVSVRNDAITDDPTMWKLNTLISLICLLPIGAIVGLLTLFLLRGTSGSVLNQVSGVVQVESPFGVAFACTLAAMFSDRILAALARLLEHFGFAKTPAASQGNP